MPTSKDDTALAFADPPDAGLRGEGDAPLPSILHLIGSLDRGGTEHQLVEMIRRSPDPRRHLVLTWSGTGALAEELPHPPIWSGATSRRSGRPRAALAACRNIRRVIREEGVRLIDAHLSDSEWMAVAAEPVGVPIVVSRRGRTFAFDERPWYRVAQGVAHRRVRLMITNSEELAAFTLRNDLNVPPVAVVRNGVDLERFSVSALPTAPVVTVVANLIAYKRHDLFIRAFALVVRRIPQAQAVLVGDGPERDALRALASSLGVSDHVRFVGQVPDVRPFIECARLVALTSDHEGLPNALLEAMAMGRPVLARAVGGIPELVRDGGEGWLTDDDPASIADGMVRALGLGPQIELAAIAARHRAESFGWDRVVSRTEDLYRRVAAGQRWTRGTRVT